MSNSRIQPPSVNLKERIAALQQRNVSPSQRPVTTNAALGPAAAAPSGGLRDKIAKFERKGGIPVPRGSFGLGAPPPNDNLKLRKRGELYGNRIPGPLRVTSGGLPGRSGAPQPFTASPRSVSLSNPNVEDTTPRPSPVTPNFDIDPPSTSITPLDTTFDIEYSGSNISDGAVSVPEEFDDHDDAPGAGFHETLDVPVSIIVSSEDAIPASARPDVDPALADYSFDKESTGREEDVVPNDPDAEAGSIHETTLILPIDEPLDLLAVPSDDPPKLLVEENGGQPPESPELSTNGDADTLHNLNIEDSPHAEEDSAPPSDDETSQQVIEEQDIHDASPRAPSPGEQFDKPLELSALAAVEIIITEEPTSETTGQTSPDKFAEIFQRVIEEQDIHDASTLAPSPEQFDAPSESSTPAVVEIIITEEPIGETTGHTFPYEFAPESPIGVVSGGGEDPASLTEPELPSALSSESAESQVLVEYPTLVAEPETLSRPPDSPIARLAYDIPESTTSSPTTDMVALPSSSSFGPDSFTLTVATNSNPRPLSMLETNASPSHVTLAHRITPVTSRGRPVFLPAPAPATSEDQDEREFGSVSLHKTSHSFSHPQTYHSHYSDPNLIATNLDSTFSAVVHGKIKDNSLARISSTHPPATPQVSRVKQSAMTEAPPSPGAYGDLAALLEEAALLEKTLSNGELPSEADHPPVQLEAIVTPSPAVAIVEEEPPVQLVAPVRSRSFFRNPMARHESTTRTEPHTREAHVRGPRSGFVTPPNKSETPTQQITVSGPMLDNGSTVTVSVENDIPPTPPPKSPRPRYLSGLRRLASSSRSSHAMPGAYPRNSISTSSEISSEDSMPVITPSEHSLESSSYGSISEFGRRSSHGSHVPWPSVSPKKSGGSISRAASFAEKIWHRARTRSTASTVSSAEIAAESMAEPMPRHHPMMPSNAIPETLEPVHSQRVINPPPRSASLRVASPNTSSYSSISATPLPHDNNTPFIPSSSQSLIRKDLIPALVADRPSSWISVSSTGSSLASPLFDKDLFDAFPGVPQIIPPAPTGHYRNKSRPSLPIPSFEPLTPAFSLHSSGVQPSTSTDLHIHSTPIPHGTKSLGRASTSPWIRTSTETTR